MAAHRATRMQGRGGIAADWLNSLYPRALVACSLIYGWVIMYFFNDFPWLSLAREGVASGRLFFIGGMLAGLLAGLSLTCRSTFKVELIGTTAAASLLALFLRLMAASRWASPWGCAVFGVLAGGSFGGMFHIWIFSFPAVPRILSVALVHLSGGTVSLVVLGVAEIFGAVGGMAADMAVPIVAIWLVADIDMGRVDDPSKAELPPFPYRLIGIVVILLLLFYFSSFLPERLFRATNGDAWANPSGWERFIVSSSVYLLALSVGRRLHVLVLLYMTILLQLIGYGLMILDIGASYGPFALVIADSIGNVFLFTLVFDILHKHRRRPMIGALLAWTVSAGTAFGMLMGGILEASGLSDPYAFIGIMVVLYATSLGILTMLLKVLEQELAVRFFPREETAEASGSGSEGEASVALLDPA